MLKSLDKQIKFTNWAQMSYLYHSGQNYPDLKNKNSVVLVMRAGLNAMTCLLVAN